MEQAESGRPAPSPVVTPATPATPGITDTFSATASFADGGPGKNDVMKQELLKYFGHLEARGAGVRSTCSNSTCAESSHRCTSGHRGVIASQEFMRKNGEIGN